MDSLLEEVENELNENKDSEEIELQDIDPQVFDEKFADLLNFYKKQGKTRILGILQNAKNEIEAHVWTMKVENSLQMASIEEEKGHFVPLLRDELSNPSMEFTVEIDHSRKQKKEYFTIDEKIKFFEKENPYFRVLVSRFKLRLDH